MTGLRDQWAAGGETLGAWLTVASFASAEIAARQPVDYVCVDMQHGVTDYLATAQMLQAIQLAGTTPLVRVPWNEPGIIGKVLDAGAHGVIVPMVNSRAEAEAVARAVRYPPTGARSWGPVMAGPRQAGYREWAERSVAAIPMIETEAALSNLDDILAVPGIDAVYVGPADLGISLGLSDSGSDGVPVFDEALAAVVGACRRHGVVPGIHASGAQAALRRAQGFRMITVANDALALARGIELELAAARGADEVAASGDRLY